MSAMKRIWFDAKREMSDGKRMTDEEQAEWIARNQEKLIDSAYRRAELQQQRKQKESKK
jgi:hypothetical protein